MDWGQSGKSDQSRSGGAQRLKLECPVVCEKLIRLAEVLCRPCSAIKGMVVSDSTPACIDLTLTCDGYDFVSPVDLTMGILFRVYIWVLMWFGERTIG
mmetsp:Transcript_51540/g.134645  ORF Transcript_51540/g.134645 Transcript_51540/m.134645 type:complete len:98 (+) Transcript_51540:339-632(+)